MRVIRGVLFVCSCFFCGVLAIVFFQGPGLPGHQFVSPNDIFAIAASRSGDRMAWVSQTGRLVVWNKRTAQPIIDERLPKDVVSGTPMTLMFSADEEELLLSLSNGRWLARWNCSNGHPHEIVSSPVPKGYRWAEALIDSEMAFSWSTDAKCSLWSLEKGDYLTRVKSPIREAEVHACTVSPDGSKIAILAEHYSNQAFSGWQLVVLSLPDLKVDLSCTFPANVDDRRVRLEFGLSTGFCEASSYWRRLYRGIGEEGEEYLWHRGSVCGVVFSSDQKTVLAGTMLKCFVVDLETKSVRHEIPTPNKLVLKELQQYSFLKEVVGKTWQGDLLLFDFTGNLKQPTIQATEFLYNNLNNALCK